MTVRARGEEYFFIFMCDPAICSKKKKKNSDVQTRLISRAQGAYSNSFVLCVGC